MYTPVRPRATTGVVLVDARRKELVSRAIMEAVLAVPWNVVKSIVLMNQNAPISFESITVGAFSIGVAKKRDKQHMLV